MAEKLSDHTKSVSDRLKTGQRPLGQLDQAAAVAALAPDGAFRSFIENLPVIFYAVEAELPHKPIYISRTVEQFGYPFETWMNDPNIWARVIHGEDRDKVLDGTRAAMAAGEGIDFEYRVVGADGSIFWVRDRSCFIKDEDGVPVCWQGVILDVTEQKHAADALGDSEARYQQLFENANDIIYVHDLAGNYISINDAAARIFGYSKDEALAMNLATVVAPEDLGLIQRNLARKIAGDLAQTTYEADCISKFGDRITLEVNSTLIKKNGVPVAIQGIARDITERKRAEDLSRKNEERYRDLFENANDLIYTHDMDGNFTSLNRAGELITGYSRDEALKMNIAEVVAPEYLNAARTMTARKVVDERPTTYELEIAAKDGHHVFLELSTRLIVSDGLPVGVQGIARDITDRKLAQESLQNTVSLFASTFESTADGIIVIDVNGMVVTCNRKFIEMWDAPQPLLDTKDGANLLEWITDKLDQPELFKEKQQRLRLDPMATSTDLLELTDGRIYERYSQPQFMDGIPVGRVCCFRDITERSLAEARLRHYALHDTLTDLPNRAEFMNHLRQAVDRSDGNDYARFAVLFLDLDRFKVINDSLGHATGDKLLIAIAERLKSCVRPGDVVARLGGDEFTILLNRSGGANEVTGVAERLQTRISEPFRIDNYEVFTTASIGIILSGKTKRQPEDFLRDADAAMYRAKESGKARYEIFDREMHVRNMNLLQVETDLRHAVDRDEFEVLYQPIVDLGTGRVAEFEALIRWQHPKLGMISPNEFVGVAEETGLIIPIGKWILERSCQQIAKWQKCFDMPLAISVNLSAKQLLHPTLTTQVSDTLRSTGLNPSQLKLEVTESTVMEHSERSMKVLSELHGLGIALSTDDFGTGYSSLSYLQKFPFERLKIDRSFISLMDEDEKSGAIVKTILMLGENLGIDVVAEGIETESQLDKLRSLGCKMGQGYYFSRPIDVETAESLLVNGPDMFGLSDTPQFSSNCPTIEVPEVQ